MSANDYRCDKNISFDSIVKNKKLLELPNFTRQPIWKTFVEAQCNAKSFFFFGKSWMAATSLFIFLYLSRVFDQPPLNRLDKYWLNSPKFRILTAFHNQNQRPAFKISSLTHNIRYYFRGIDYPFGINEWKDYLFKLREMYLIEKTPSIQYPYVHRQFSKVSLPEKMQIHLEYYK